MITKSGIDTKNFQFKSAGFISQEFFMSYTAKTPTDLFVLTNKNGVEACITNVGARLVSCMVPDKNGDFVDVVLGYDTLAGYIDTSKGMGNYQGAVVGRYANRIANGNFDIDNKNYSLPQNNGTNCLHGGSYGWAYQTFSVCEKTDNKLVLQLIAPDGENGFPGNVVFIVTYTLNDDNSLHINYEATTDAQTVINVTNHSYFNLNSDNSKDVLNHELFINAKQMTPLNEHTCPNGEIVDIVADGPFDFYGLQGSEPRYYARGKVVGQDISADDPQIKLGNGYDHNFVLQSLEESGAANIESYNGKIPLCAKVYSPETGISMKIFTDQPGVQLYDSVDLDGSTIGKNSIPLQSNCGLCLETQHFADSPHNPHFPSTALLPGQKFTSTSIYQF